MITAFYKLKCNRSNNVCYIERKSDNILSDVSEYSRENCWCALSEKVREAFEQRRLHLDKNLTLSKLARECGTNRTYMSLYFNGYLKVGFNDYLNRYRVEHESIPLIRANPHLLIEEIALRSGFNSVVTFRRAFISVTGQTPRNYRMHIRRQAIMNS